MLSTTKLAVKILGKNLAVIWSNLIILYICWMHTPLKVYVFFKQKKKPVLKVPIESVYSSIAFVVHTDTMNIRVFYSSAKQTPYSLWRTPNYQFCFPPRLGNQASTFYFYRSAYSGHFTWIKQNHVIFLSGLFSKTCAQGSSMRKYTSLVHSCAWVIVHCMSTLQSVFSFSSWWVIRLLPLFLLRIRLGWTPCTSFGVNRHFRFSYINSKK